MLKDQAINMRRIIRDSIDVHANVRQKVTEELRFLISDEIYLPVNNQLVHCMAFVIDEVEASVTC